MKRIGGIVLIGSVLLCTVWMISARVRSVQSEEKLSTIIARHQFVLVFFYHKQCESRDYRSSLKRVQRMLGQLSDRWEYKEAELQFVQARVDDDVMMETFLNKAGIRSFPSFALFEDGRIMEIDEQPVMLEGCADYNDVRSFIDDAIGDDLADYREEKEEERERQRELRAYYWNMSWPYYAGWGCGYPYWGYPYGGYYGSGCGGCYGGAYIGFGF